MPVKRRVSKRRQELSDEAVLWLEGSDAASRWLYAQSQADLAQIWSKHGSEVLAEWIERHPGTRPARWWEFEAPRSPIGTYPGCNLDETLPEPRRRMGGIGTPAHEVLANVPHFASGIPVSWISQWQADFYTGRALDVRGEPIGQEHAGKPFSGLPVAFDDPPRFEAQASYLKRHGLLLSEEEARLTPADFAEEVLAP